ETAVAAAQLGANLVLTARNEKGLQSTAARIAELKTDSTVTLLAGDLSKPEFCTELVHELVPLESLDAVVLNAAKIEPIGSIENLDEDEWLESVQLNLAAPFRLARRLIPSLVK